MNVKPISDENYVEMLTVNDEGRAIPGTMYPRDLGVVVFHDEDDEELVAERMGWNEPDESSVTQT